MPLKLNSLQLRFLNNFSLSLTVKFTATPFQSSRTSPIFVRAFSFKLNYSGAVFPNFKNRSQQLCIRNFSSARFGGHRPSSSSDFSRSKERGEVGASKSLVEDEAELSDWISELKTDSFRGLLTSEEEDSDTDRRRSSVRSRNQDSDSSMKRRRDSVSEQFGGSNRGRGRGGRGSFDSNTKRRFDNGADGEAYAHRNGSLRGKGGRSSTFGAKRDVRDSSFENKRELMDSDNGFNLGRNNQGGSRGGSSSFEARRGGSRGGRGSDFGHKRDQGSMKSAKRAPMISEDEDDDDDAEKKSLSNFKDLLGEEDSDDEVINNFVSEDEDDDDEKNKNTLLGIKKEINGKLPSKKSSGQNDSYLSETRFDQCAVSALSLKGVKDAGYEKMTMVQEATLPVILKGKDVLAKAKTGTGKTVAFLLPSIEAVVNSPPIGRDQKRPPIYVLVVCPTRELANQAAAEANKLLKYHPSIGVQVVIGGTRLGLEQKRMQTNPCQILVATPGRLKDHIENTAGFATRLMCVKVLVLDEADHLLDMGFRKDIERIIAAVPKQRQTLLFSATVPEEVRQICHVALKRDHEFINAVQEGSEDTHSQVKQTHLVAPLDKQFSLLYALLKDHISDDADYKVLVFCTTAMVTRLVADLLGELNLNVREIHSRKPQSYRTRISDEFRKSKGLILVTSDVSARGVDYPDVTLVIQVGVPSDREQYIHRLGRTGRKGKEGLGILMLAPWEEYFLSSIKDLPITKASVPSVDPDTKKKVERALFQTDMKNKEAAYQAWLGYYNSVKNVGKNKHRLVELANEFSRSMGLDNPPAIPKLVLGKMGLRNIPGLRSK